jgi:hypothetical protein
MVIGRVRQATADRVDAWKRSLAARMLPFVVRWEKLPAHTQIVAAFPTLVVLLFIIHITLFRQPLGRSVLYGFFWGILGTYLVVIASRTEAAKRARRERGEAEEEDDEL